jgi:hypothetical protein
MPKSVPDQIFKQAEKFNSKKKEGKQGELGI